LTSFRGAFVFDDLLRIVPNLHIRRLWPPADVLAGTSRPLVQATLALNWALSGLDPWSYHAFNLAVHVAAALVLLALLRRTLAGPPWPAPVRDAADGLALGIALLWAVHPLQTQAVTYVIQRSEAMVGLFSLLVLYCVARGVDSRVAWRWYAGAIGCGLVGALTKPVIVTAPFLALAWDRTFAARSWRELRARRGWLYLALLVAAASAGAVLLHFRGDWSRSAGFSFGRVSAGEYAASQPAVVAHYLRLVVWPRPLVLDYGWPVARRAADVVPGAIVVGLVVVATLWALRRRPGLGFFGLWFLLALAPSSSVVPIADLAFEHRMYLASAGAIAALVLVADELLRRASPRGRTIGAALAATVAVVLAAVTASRNLDYRSELAIWTDTAAKRPENPRAHQNLAVALDHDGRLPEAAAEYREALRLRPGYADALSGLGFVLYRQGEKERAVEAYRAALVSEPWNDGAQTNLGVALDDAGKPGEAMGHFEEALATNPTSAEAHYNIGVALARLGRLAEAAAHERTALEIRPAYPEAHANLGVVLAEEGDLDGAIRELDAAVRLRPDYADAHFNLAVALARRGRLEEARAHARAALAARPGFDAAERLVARLGG
jgi:tetratricopeptide (TPR) repeat protein